MAGNIYKNYFLLAIAFVLINVCQLTDTCKEKKPCLCQLSDSTAIDISKLSSKPLHSEFGGNYSYFYSPCRNTQLFKNCENTSLCLVFNNTTGEDLGTAEEGIFTNATGQFQITFKKPKKSTTINLVCAPIETPILLVHSKTDTDNVLYLLSNHACIVHYHHNGSLSTGSVLLIIFSIGFAIYIIGGAIVLYVLRGARGYEMIPNIDFWRGLPSLIRDGFLFLLNGCSLPTTVTSTAETYDRI